MAGTQLLQPDRQFVGAILASGGGDLKKCFQCATCSVVCGLSTGRTAFPRKEMHWAQWGLRDRLMADPDIWLCHQCNDCSRRCPRGARPGDVLAAVRRQAVQHYAVPHRFAEWVNRAGTLPLMLLIPVVLLALALWARDPVAQALGMGPPEGFYAQLFPHWLLIGFFSFFTVLALVLMAAGVVPFWRAMKAADVTAGAPPPVRGLGASILATLRAVFVHDRFAECETRATRRWTHLLVFYGFLILFVVTVYAVFDLYLKPALFGLPTSYPFHLAHPMKILANAGALLLVVGTGKAIWERGRHGAGVEVSTSFDWILVWLLLGLGLTGLLIEVFRFLADGGAGATLQSTAYTIYFVHLVLVFGLLGYLPYSKFAHIVYRTVAMVYGEHTGRHREVVRLATVPGSNGS